MKERDGAGATFPLWAAAFKKASPARGGGTEGDGGVHCRVAFSGIFPGCAKPAQGPMIFIGPEKAAAAGKLAGRCGHRPLRMRGKALPGFAGYLCRRAAMHPSVGWRRQLPLQGRLWNAAAKKPPLQGEVDAPQAQTEGCIAALPFPVSFRAAQSLRRGR